MILLFFTILQIGKSINTKKFAIGEWQVYNEANTASLYTIEFHIKKNDLNSANNKDNAIIGTVWSNKIYDSNGDDQLENFDPDNFIICSFELIFTTPNEGNIKYLNYNKENHLLLFSHFLINEIENKNIIITLKSDSLKLTCTFTDSTNGVIKYQNLINTNEAEISMNIVKSPKISFIPWTKYFVYLFYTVFVIVFIRTILIVRYSLIQRARESQKLKNKENEKKEENSQQSVEKEEKPHNDIKDHQKTE